jgi:hypothetical protein
MKNYKLLTLIFCFAASTLFALTADQYVTAGTNSLVAQDMAGAYSNFNAAVTLSPTNETANAFLAVTRLLVLPQQPAGSNFLNQLNVTNGSRSIYNWTAMQPVDTNGNTIWPANYNSSTAIAFYRNTVVAALVASGTNLANITDTNFTLSLLATETGIGKFPGANVTLDYGDFQLLRALVAAGQFAGYTINAQNASVVIPTLQAMSEANGLTFQAVLAAYPSLLSLSSAADLAASKGALTNAIVFYLAASDYIRNIRPTGPPGQGLFMLDNPKDIAEEQVFRDSLTNVLLSVNGPVQISPNTTVSLDLSNYYSGAKTLRSLMPKFSANAYLNDSLPDYTFGGILLDEPAYLTETALRNHFYSYAGIYGGPVDDLNFNDLNAGSFSVFVGTNQQVTVVGYDADSAYYFGNSGSTQYGGISAQFITDQDGNWQFNSNSPAGVSGYGSIGKDGSFSGELDFTNGDSVWLNGYEQPALGPFQNAAGKYSGTASVAGGTLQAVLSADGSLVFCVFINGVQNDGGSGQLGANNYFTTTSINGATVSGTLNPSTFQFTGNFNSSGGSGTWTMSRSARIAFDLPPVITTNLPSIKAAPLGTNVTFFLVVTGSPPMCYQWYFDETAIPNAITNTLVVSNLVYGSAGTYSVTINNVAGATNAAVSLNVVPETIPPTNQITAPTPGLQVSNTLYTVTGKAGDNVAVSNVWYQLNNGGWNPANTANRWTNWSAPVTLMQGSNTVQAYAVDTSGNVSATNSVIFDFIPSATLTVSTNGLGSLSPNDNGALLQIGKTYSITATAGTGFVFSNWTGGTSLPLSVVTNKATVQFMMVTNLMLQANFLDVTKPTLLITAPTAGQRWSNAVFNLTGTASDNWLVTNVQYQVNGSGWNNANSGNHWSNWTAAVNLAPGTNAIGAYAVDSSGNLSLTSSVSLDYVVTNQLGIRALGLGTISPNDSNAWLEVGRNYSIAATPATGFVVTNWMISTNWIGGVKTNSATVQFMMASNLTLQVTFADVTKPMLTLTAPAAGQHMTNALATVVGTASDNWKVSAVWYQLTNGILTSGTWSLVTTTNGYTNWTTTLTLAAGTNTVKAYAVDLGGNYSTTSSVSVLSSNTFQLQLKFTGAPPLTSTGLNFALQLSSGLNGHIQTSTNLADWITLTNFVGTNTTLNFRDPGTTNLNRRFYRAVVP